MKKIFLVLFSFASFSAFAKPGDVIKVWGSVNNMDMLACEWSLDEMKNQAENAAWTKAKQVCNSNVQQVSDFTFIVQCPDDAFPWASVVARASFQCE